MTRRYDLEEQNPELPKPIMDVTPTSANSCTYDLPISVLAEYSIPPLCSGLGGTPKMHTPMADQNYRTREYHEFVKELAELHRPIVKSITMMPCPVCDSSWYVKSSPEAKPCIFWQRAVKFNLVKQNELDPPVTITVDFPEGKRTFAMNVKNPADPTRYDGEYINMKSGD